MVNRSNAVRIPSGVKGATGKVELISNVVGTAYRRPHSLLKIPLKGGRLFCRTMSQNIISLDGYEAAVKITDFNFHRYQQCGHYLRGSPSLD
jgi:hypothetical protein